MRHLKTLASALAIVLVVLMATDYVAMAATGKPLILGKVNKANQVTVIKNPKGAALKLVPKSGSAPLKVTNDTKVTNLNADMVDGHHAKGLGVRTMVETFTMTGTLATEVTHVVEDVPAGTYIISYSMLLNVDEDVSGYCQVKATTPLNYNAFASAPGQSSGFLPMSGSAVYRLSATQNVTLICTLEAPTDVSTYQKAQMSFTAINTQTGSTLP